jgi:hypothetical protein
MRPSKKSLTGNCGGVCSHQMEEEATSSLRASPVEAPATSGYSLLINRRNGDTLIGYSGQAALRKEQCDVRSDS